MIVLDVHIINQRRSYVAKFATDEQAVAFIQDREPKGPRWNGHLLLGEPCSGHVFALLEETDQPTPLLDAILDPECTHGLSARNCYGPQHYYYDSEEQGRGLVNTGAWM